MISEYVYFFRRAFAILSAVTFISNYGFARERLLENMKDGSFRRLLKSIFMKQEFSQSTLSGGKFSIVYTGFMF